VRYLVSVVRRTVVSGCGLEIRVAWRRAWAIGVIELAYGRNMGSGHHGGRCFPLAIGISLCMTGGRRGVYISRLPNILYTRVVCNRHSF
jgi:hypothetical protein